ncbi:MAG: HEAT repeat domain-containing protein, partial [Cyanobacteriota bacterium]|nr:HEAT repeat domain-containing protein [Cyanobacteriota bacterium]
MDWNTLKKSLNSPKLALLCLSVGFLLIGKMATEATTTAEVIAQIEQLNTGNRQNRLSAVKTLKKIGSPAIPVLIEALHDRDVNVRKNAAFALGSMGAEATEAVPALLSALKDADQAVRMDVAVALRHIGPTSPDILNSAIADLTLALNDENPQVRQGAAFGLGILGNNAASAV